MRLVLVIAALAVSACAVQPLDAGEPALDRERKYRVTATVLEDAEHGPQLCGGVRTSLPPQCGGPDIVGWDWKSVRHESVRGVTWGQYMMTGTWDGERFTLTEPATPGSFDGAAQPRPPNWTTDLSIDELLGIQRRLHDEFPFPLMYASHVDEERRIVIANTFRETPDLRSAVDAAFGERVVYLNSMLQPVE